MVSTSFLKIIGIADGTASTITGAVTKLYSFKPGYASLFLWLR